MTSDSASSTPAPSPATSGPPARSHARHPLPASVVALPLRIALLAAVVAMALLLPCAGVDAPPPRDLSRLREALRAGDAQALDQLTADPASLNGRDALGNSPLLLAAQLGTPESVRRLLERGADAAATNHAGVSALHRAAADPAKVRLLLDRGADPLGRTALGHTPLMLAARSPGATECVRLLLERGADVHARSLYGATALMAAAAAANLDAVRLLVARGADTQAEPFPQGPVGDHPIWGGLRTPLMWAAFRGDLATVSFLLDHGARADQVSGFGTALTQTGWRGHREVAELLLQHGAEVRQAEPFSGFTALHWAASAETGSAEFARFLADHGADLNAEGGQPVDAFLGIPQTPWSLARQRGETALTQWLRQAGARDATSPSATHASLPSLPSAPATLSPESRPAADAPGRRDLEDALRAAIPPLQQTAEFSHASFVRHASKQDCTSCHQQYFPMAAIGRAHARQVPTDRPAASRLTELVLRVHRDAELDAQPLFHPDPAHEFGYALLGLRLEGTHAPDVTDPLVNHLAAIQAPDGHWSVNLYRPPLQSSDITATALGIHALQHFGWPARAAEFTERLTRARRWLTGATPESTEEVVYQLLGLVWAGVPTSELRAGTDHLLRDQRSDGGWAQLPGLASDAYATGQALFALQEAAGLDARHPATQRAAAFLLRSQQPDGSWHVRRRAFPFQPTMESGFPHGRDSWISATGTSWAVMALATLLDSHPMDRSPAPVSLSSLSMNRPSPPAPLPPVGRGWRREATPGEDTPPGSSSTQHGMPESSSLPPSRNPLPRQPVDFGRDIQPVLERSCVGCHSGDRPRGNYRLTDRTGLLSPGNLGTAAVVAGHSDRSPLLRHLLTADDDLSMPPLGQRDRYPALMPAEVERVRDWIDQGAPWPADVALRPAAVRTAAR